MHAPVRPAPDQAPQQQLREGRRVHAGRRPCCTRHRVGYATSSPIPYPQARPATPAACCAWQPLAASMHSRACIAEPHVSAARASPARGGRAMHELTVPEHRHFVRAAENHCATVFYAQEHARALHAMRQERTGGHLEARSAGAAARRRPRARRAPRACPLPCGARRGCRARRRGYAARRRRCQRRRRCRCPQRRSCRRSKTTSWCSLARSRSHTRHRCTR